MAFGRKKEYVPRVEGNKLFVPHGKGEIAFADAFFGPGSYHNIAKQIEDKGFVPPNGEQLASLIYSVYCQDNLTRDPEFGRVFHNSLEFPFWIFGTNVVTEKGIYILQTDERAARGLQISGNINKHAFAYHMGILESLVEHGKEVRGVKFSKDEKIRFAPKESYGPGPFYTRSDFEKDGFMTATFGEDSWKMYESFRAARMTPFSGAPNPFDSKGAQVGFSSLGADEHGFLITGNEFGDFERYSFAVMPN